MSTKRSNRITLIALMVLFAVPPLLAVLMHTPWLRYEFTATRNAGEFVDPLVSLDGVVRAPGSEQALFVSAENIWSVMYLMPQDCDLACIERLELLERVRLATGRHMPRARVLVRAPDQAEWPPAQIDPQLVDEFVMVSETTHVAALLPDLADGSRASVYLLDPEGRALMHYPEPLQGTDLRKDFQLLLNRSKNGR